MHTRLILLGMSVHLTLAAQIAQGVNLVPNPGFEEYDTLPGDWFYSGKDFTHLMKYWESPTGASPDVYGSRVYVPRDWREKGFGQAKPRHGHSMVGITLYGCHGGKPHCREYIQVELYEALVPGQRYEVSFWIQPLPLSLQIDHLDAAFISEPIHLISDDQLSVMPPHPNTKILAGTPGQWLHYNAEFHADTTAGYLIIGNFYRDEETTVSRECGGECLPFAYYYIDDVVLKKLPPILPVPIAEDHLSRAELDEGKTIRLNYIFFASGKADFLPRSFHELNTLLEMMRESPEMIIEVRGHTDNLGTDEFNTDLSFRRAQNVVLYLIEHGIAPERMSYQGFASRDPIAENETEEGRRRNRRVEFVVLRM